MALKCLFAIVLVTVLTQGSALTTIQLDDVTTTHVTSIFHPKSIGIPKPNLFDTLVGCQVIYPNGQIIQAFPTNQLVAPASFAGGNHPFTSCSIFFENPPVSMSGTYELLSHVRSVEDNSETLTRQRFHITFVEADLWGRTFANKLKEAMKTE